MTADAKFTPALTRSICPKPLEGLSWLERSRKLARERLATLNPDDLRCSTFSQINLVDIDPRHGGEDRGLEVVILAP